MSTETARRRGRAIADQWESRFTLLTAGVDQTREDFARDVREGLSGHPKKLSCRFFYDAAGSRLFEQICRLPEYYPFRAERQILSTRAREIVMRAGHPADLVELGSGSAEKTLYLIDALLAAQGRLLFVPIDISPTALEASARALLRDRPALRVVGVAGEYDEGLRRLPAAVTGRRLFLWLGSNIGNLSRARAKAFVGRLRDRMGADDRLLLGIDLRKDESVVLPAYDDAQGVTARFNKNLLARINRDLGADFDLDAFDHRALWLEEEGRIEAHLVSRRPQTVHVHALGLEVSFEEGEGIHTESSVKYSREEIAELAEAAGLVIDATWDDSGERFREVLLRPR